MTTPDVINGCFEGVGSILIWLNVFRLAQDKTVKGSNWWVMIFFASWAVFNLYFYPHLGQEWSFLGGLSMFVAEFVWVVMAYYYCNRSKIQ